MIRHCMSKGMVVRRVMVMELDEGLEVKWVYKLAMELVMELADGLEVK
jgi:hypothetical protein